jgi:hypothetical protein
MASSPTLTAAVVKAFVSSVFFHDGETGKSPIVWYMRSYVKWRIDKAVPSLSEIELVLRHLANVKAWGERSVDDCPMKGHEGIFGPLFISFMKDRCLTSADREVALWLEMTLFSSSEEDLMPLLDRVKRYGLGERWSAETLQERIEFVRRRLVGYFDLASSPLPRSGDLNFLPVDQALSPFVALTSLSSLGEAKLLSETDSSHLALVAFTPKEQADAIEDVRFHYEQRGIKAEIVQEEDGPCLKLWMSLVDGQNPSNSFRDEKWNVVGNFKEAL